MNNSAKLLWHCRRGMRELDLLLVSYCEKSYPSADATEQQTFTRLLDLPDDLIYDYLFGEKRPDTTEMTILVNKIKKYFGHRTQQ
jgi:antitoxin CptB